MADKYGNGITKDYSKLRILIFGEAMIDEYSYGDPGGISSEALSFVVKHLKTTRNLGGSANIAQNIINLGANVDILTSVGDDEYKTILLEKMKEMNIGVIPVVTSRPTIVKRRIVVRSQQLVRIDYEDTSDVSGADEVLLLDKIKKLDPTNYDAVIISDYNKGMFTKEIVDKIFGMFEGKFVLADARPKKMHLFSKASIIKTNFTEYAEFMKSHNIMVFNTDENIEAHREFLLIHFNAYLLTRSEAGMSFLSKERIEHLPANALSVLDVTGAGDTVTATFLLEYLKTKSIKGSMLLARLSAQIVIAKKGCVPISKTDFCVKKSTYSKIISDYDELKLIVENVKKKGETIVFTNGCFDIVHSNHANFLMRAKELGDVLFVAINDDASVRRYKGPNRPIIDQKSRLILLSSFQYVDYVFLFHEDNPSKVIELVKPNIHVKGGDYKSEKCLPETETVKNSGEKVILITLEDSHTNISTTEIIKKVINVYGNNFKEQND